MELPETFVAVTENRQGVDVVAETVQDPWSTTWHPLPAGSEDTV
jgi:hypothetical protein